MMLFKRLFHPDTNQEKILPCSTFQLSLSLSVLDHPEAAGGRSHRPALKGNLSPGHQATECLDPKGFWCAKSAYHRLWLWPLLKGDALQVLLWYDICLLLLTHLVSL